MKSINNKNTIAANVTFVDPPFAIFSPIPRVTSAITQQSAATKEKNKELLTLRFSNSN
jgi:hypothetical protein